MGMRARSVCAARCPGSESVEGVGDFLGVPHSIAVETGELVQYSDFDQGLHGAADVADSDPQFCCGRV